MIEINNLTAFRIDKNILMELALKILKKESKKSLGKDLSVALVAPSRIKEFNRRYRGKNSPTDVLSFCDKESLGEIVICPAVVKSNARKLKSSFRKELSKVFVHGVLHLLGYDHEKTKDFIKMNVKEDQYLNSII